MIKKISLFSILASLAIILGYIEFLFAIPLPVAGVKLGLSNIMVLITIFYLNEKSGAAISLIKVVLCAFLFNGFSGFLYSFAGALFSFIAMCLSKRSNFFSVIGVSIIGSIFHNIGQLVVSSFFLNNYVFYYAPILIFAGAISGILTGILAQMILKKLKYIKRPD